MRTRNTCLCLMSLALLLTGTSHLAQAAPGDLDPTFGSGGIVTTAIGTSHDYGQAVALQKDGKIVVAGFGISGTGTDFEVARYLASGALDLAFGTNGSTTTDFQGAYDRAYAVALQGDGKILVGGEAETLALKYNFGLARYLSNGTLDPAFGTGGRVMTVIGTGSEDVIYGIAVQPDGKILVAGRGNYAFALARYNANGTLDATFGTGGKVVVTRFYMARALLLLADGKIVVGGHSAGSGSDFALARYSKAGVIDTTFGTAGFVTTNLGSEDGINALALSGEGRIAAAGASGAYLAKNFAFARYLANGALDPSFGTAGKKVLPVGGASANDFASGLVVQSNNKLVAVGTAAPASGAGPFAVVRLSQTGAPDPAFGAGGIVTTFVGSGPEDAATAIALQPDGKLLVVGYGLPGTSNEDFALARYEGDPPAPALSVSVAGARSTEGNSGKKPFVFRVTLSGSPTAPVTVDWRTAGATATSGVDFLAGSGRLTFNPGGALTQNIVVQVQGDKKVEPTETFKVNITVAGASAARRSATGTILNDD